MIEAANPLSLPFRFQLFIDADNIRYTCEARHVTRGRIGVTFMAADVAEAPVSNHPLSDFDEWGGVLPMKPDRGRKTC